MFIVFGFLVSILVASALPIGGGVAVCGGVSRGVRRVARAGRMPTTARGVRSLARGI